MADDVIQAIKAGGRDAQKKQLDQDVLKLTTSIKKRALGALAGICGNTAEEAVCPAYLSGASGQILDTSKFNSRRSFEPDKLPPVKAFWSVTMYDGKTRFLVENP